MLMVWAYVVSILVCLGMLWKGDYSTPAKVIEGSASTAFIVFMVIGIIVTIIQLVQFSMVRIKQMASSKPVTSWYKGLECLALQLIFPLGAWWILQDLGSSLKAPLWLPIFCVAGFFFAGFLFIGHVNRILK